MQFGADFGLRGTGVTSTSEYQSCAHFTGAPPRAIHAGASCNQIELPPSAGLLFGSMGSHTVDSNKDQHNSNDSHSNNNNRINSTIVNTNTELLF